MKQARAEMSAKFKQLNITTREAKEEYIANNAKLKGDAPTLAELKGLLRIMDMHIAEKQNADSDTLFGEE